MKNAMFCFLCLSAVSFGLSAAPVDRLQAAKLGDVRLEGVPGRKMSCFLEERVFSDFAKNVIFQEAEDAFAHPDDDVYRAPIGMWKGEFWGKLMISACRVAEYSHDANLKNFLHEKALKLITFQHPDGYLGTYVNPDFIEPMPSNVVMKATRGYNCRWNWNLWCRKYTLWGLLACYRLTGDAKILAAADRAMAQQIALMRRLDKKLCDVGTTTMRGLPPCSILKPLLWLYRDTGKSLYLDYAREIVGYWDSEDNHAPKFFRKVAEGTPLHTWYPDEIGQWGKVYEMLSCMAGLVEYWRVTGDEKSLKLVKDIREMLYASELNPLFCVGYNDQFTGAAQHLNAISEPCDSVHWMRLNFELLLITGAAKYADAIEMNYLNAFLAAICRDGRWAARGVRSAGRHMYAHGQSGMIHQHCCVNNIPRGFMDVAQSSCLRDAAGTLHVALYTDSRTVFEDATVQVAGNYPVENTICVKVKSAKARQVKFRVPAWCPQMTVNGEIAQADGEGWWARVAVAGETAFILKFDMSPRLVDNDREAVAGYDRQDFRYNRWAQERDLLELLRTKPAATLMHGPLLLAKAERAGTPEGAIFAKESLNRQGWQVTLKAVPNKNVWGAWEATFTKGATQQTLGVCDYASAADEELAEGRRVFSIWF